MIDLIYRILASASAAMWKEEPDLGDYTAATAEHELNLAQHYASRLRRWLPWLRCDCDVQKPPFGDRRPDIVCHRRGAHSANFLVVEIKRGDDIAGGREDIAKIRRYWFAKPLGYRFGASLVFNENKHTARIFVLSPGAREALDGYCDAANFIPLAEPKADAAIQACIEWTDAIFAAEKANDEARVALLKTEIDGHIFHLYGLAPAEVGAVRVDQEVVTTPARKEVKS
ncbi:MAG: hypothetical protein V7609_1734 [Verrucomicrobiota bacterium]